MTFVQIIECKTDRVDDLNQLMDTWVEQTRGQRTATHSIVAQDRAAANEVDTRGVDGVRQEVAAYIAAFDIQFTVEDQIAEGDEVSTRWTMRGTHKGEFMGLAPTGKQVNTSGITNFRLRDNKIQEGWW